MAQGSLDDFEDDLTEESEKIKDATSIMATTHTEHTVKEKPKRTQSRKTSKAGTASRSDDAKDVQKEDHSQSGSPQEEMPKEEQTEEKSNNSSPGSQQESTTSGPSLEVKNIESATAKTSSSDNFWDEDDDAGESIWKQISTWRTLSVIMVILLIFSVYTNGFSFNSSSDQMTGATVALSTIEEKVENFLNSYILQPPFTATVESAEEKAGVYRLQMKIAGQDVESYVSKDGTLLFPQAIDLDTPPPANVGPQIIERFEVSIDNDPMIGDPTAPVTIIEFSDFQCPLCVQFTQEIYPLIKEKYIDTGKVRLVYRDFPLADIHPKAELAAVAGECAFEQGPRHFWTFHDRMFADPENINAETFHEWAVELNLNVERFDKCLSMMKYRKEIYEDFGDGQMVGVTTAPTFFINGRVVTGGQPYAAFEEIIEDELRLTGGARSKPGASPKVKIFREDSPERQEEESLNSADENELQNEENDDATMAIAPSESSDVSNDATGNEEDTDDDTSFVEEVPVPSTPLVLEARRWRFLPKELNVNAGDRVELTIISNDLDFTFAIPDLGVSEPISRGRQTITFTASTPGTFPFMCSDCESFRGMTGTLIVK
jgi:protein-disulfide isomerase/plastocyanin